MTVISFALVDVKSVKSDVSRSSFSESQLEAMSETILNCDGLIKPLILQIDGIDSYSVIEGHFEYYAAVRAQEKNPRQAEMVNAFIVPKKNVELVKQQTQILQGIASPEESHPVTSTSVGTDQLQNIELRFERLVNDLRSEQTQTSKEINQRLTALEKQQATPQNLLEELNTKNQDELAIKFKRYRIAKADAIAKALVTARKKKTNQQFEDYLDIVSSVKGLGEKTMLTLINDWQ